MAAAGSVQLQGHCSCNASTAGMLRIQLIVLFLFLESFFGFIRSGVRECFCRDGAAKQWWEDDQSLPVWAVRAFDMLHGACVKRWVLGGMSVCLQEEKTFA